MRKGGRGKGPYLSEAHERAKGTAYGLGGVGDGELPLDIHPSIWEDPEGGKAAFTCQQQQWMCAIANLKSLSVLSAQETSKEGSRASRFTQVRYEMDVTM